VRAEGGAQRARPTLSDFGAALGTLTALPFERADPQGAAFARASLFFPVTGLAIGAVLVSVERLLATHLPAALAAVLLIVAWEALGGFGALAAWVAARRALETSSRVGTAVIGLLLAIKAAGLYHAGPVRAAALLFAPTLGCWAIVVLAVGARAAAAPTHKYNTGIAFREFAVTSVFTFATLFLLGEATGVLLTVWAGMLTLSVRVLLHRWPGGVSWAWLQAGRALVETAVVLLLAGLAR
jgi:hypothetical protein